MLEFLFGPKNPTKTWPPARDVPLVLDLNSPMLNGVRLGQDLDALAFLGPVEDRAALANDELSYCSKGLAVRYNQKSHCIVEFRIVHSDPYSPTFSPFVGKVVLNGQATSLAKITQQQLFDAFGDWFWLDRDKEEIIVFYEIGGIEWQIEFDLASRLNCITTTNEPLMADERQRVAYGVTTPWPT